MSVVLTDCKILLGGYNLSGYHNQLELNYGAEMLDDTVFGTSGTRSSKPGLKTAEFSGTIFWDADIDEPIFERIGAAREVLTCAQEGNAVGDVAYSTRATQGQYNPLSGEVGQLLTAAIDGRASNTPLVRGRVLLPLGARTATGTGDEYQLGAVTSTQRLYAALHVLAPSGTSPSFTAELKSAPASGFASPTTRITFAAATALGAQWEELAGAITDQYWRVDWTISGTAPEFNAYMVVGIL